MHYDKELYLDLSSRIKSGDSEFLKSFLFQHKDLDVTYYEEGEYSTFCKGKFFILSINVDLRGKDITITNTLLNFFETVQLPQHEPNSSKYIILKYRLTEALKIAVEDENIPDKMRNLLSKYISFGDAENDYSTKLSELDKMLEEPHSLGTESVDNESGGHTNGVDGKNALSKVSKNKLTSYFS